MKNRLSWAVLILVLGQVSCKKSDSTPTPTPAVVSYFSATAGNSWNYEYTSNPGSTPVVSSYSLTSTNRDSSINGHSYHVFSRTDAVGAEYYYINNSDYYEYLNLPVLDTIRSENLFLKSDLAAGASWTQNLSPVTYLSITANLAKSDTIIEKNISKTVKGIVYDSVIHVRGAIKIVSIVPPLITPTLTSTIDNYYAPRVGRIYSYLKVHLTAPAPFSIDETFENKTELVSTNF